MVSFNRTRSSLAPSPTRCPACRRPHAWNVGTGGPPVGGHVAQFLVPAARMWDDVMRTCGHQRLFCSEDCVAAWLEETGLPRGYVMDLGTLWRLAAHWYEGRLERGYTRRDPARAADYLRSARLSRQVWGLGPRRARASARPARIHAFSEVFRPAPRARSGGTFVLAPGAEDSTWQCTFR